MQFAFEYGLTIMEIIESKNRQIPMFVYQVMITINFYALAGYVLSTFEIKPLFESKINAIATFNELSCFTFALLYIGMDHITMVFFIVLDTLLYGYFFYVGMYTFLRLYLRRIFEQIQGYLDQINQLLNLFFTSFWWLLFTPYVDINSGMIVKVVGPTSYLVEYRDDLNYDHKPWWQITLGSISIAFLTLLAAILIYCFRNYEFCDQNYLKRRFQYFLIFMLSIHNFMILCYYLNLPLILQLKHVCVHIVGLSYTMDFFLEIPFSNKSSQSFLIFLVSKCIIVNLVYFETAIIVTSTWMFTDYINDYDMFYLIYLPLPIGYSLGYKIYEQKVYKIHHNAALRKYTNNFDQGLEYLYEGYFLGTKSEDNYRYLMLMALHRNNCNDLRCPCHRSNDQESEFIQFCEYSLRYVIYSSKFKPNLLTQEHFKIKYISFLGKAKKNYLFQLLELRRIQCRLRQQTLFFKYISIIISRQAETGIRGGYKQFSELDDQQLRIQEFIEQTIELHEPLQQVEQELIQILFQRKAFLRSIADTYKKHSKIRVALNRYTDQIRLSVSLIQQIKSKVQTRFRYCSHCYYDYIMRCFAFFIDYDFRLININHNQLSDIDAMSNKLLMNNETLILFIGLNQNHGEILDFNIKKPQIAQFFGYDIEELFEKKYINHFLPTHLQAMYQNYISEFFLQGQISQVHSTFKVFLQDAKGYIFLCNLNFRIIFSLNNYVNFWVALTKDQSPKKYIIVDQGGYLIGRSSHLLNKDGQDLIQITDPMKEGDPFMLRSPNFMTMMVTANTVLRHILDFSYPVYLQRILSAKQLKIHIGQNVEGLLAQFQILKQKEYRLTQLHHVFELFDYLKNHPLDDEFDNCYKLTSDIYVINQTQGSQKQNIFLFVIEITDVYKEVGSTRYDSSLTKSYGKFKTHLSIMQTEEQFEDMVDEGLSKIVENTQYKFMTGLNFNHQSTYLQSLVIRSPLEDSFHGGPGEDPQIIFSQEQSMFPLRLLNVENETQNQMYSTRGQASSIKKLIRQSQQLKNFRLIMKKKVGAKALQKKKDNFIKLEETPKSKDIVKLESEYHSFLRDLMQNKIKLPQPLQFLYITFFLKFVMIILGAIAAMCVFLIYKHRNIDELGLLIQPVHISVQIQKSLAGHTLKTFQNVFDIYIEPNIAQHYILTSQEYFEKHENYLHSSFSGMDLFLVIQDYFQQSLYLEYLAQLDHSFAKKVLMLQELNYLVLLEDRLDQISNDQFDFIFNLLMEDNKISFDVILQINIALLLGLTSIFGFQLHFLRQLLKYQDNVNDILNRFSQHDVQSSIKLAEKQIISLNQRQIKTFNETINDEKEVDPFSKIKYTKAFSIQRAPKLVLIKCLMFAVSIMWTLISLAYYPSFNQQSKNLFESTRQNLRFQRQSADFTSAYIQYYYNLIAHIYRREGLHTRELSQFIKYTDLVEEVKSAGADLIEGINQLQNNILTNDGEVSLPREIQALLTEDLCDNLSLIKEQAFGIEICESSSGLILRKGLVQVILQQLTFIALDINSNENQSDDLRSILEKSNNTIFKSSIIEYYIIIEQCLDLINTQFIYEVFMREEQGVQYFCVVMIVSSAVSLILFLIMFRTLLYDRLEYTNRIRMIFTAVPLEMLFQRVTYSKLKTVIN